MIKEKDTVILPVLALRGMTLFPGMQLSFEVGREKSIRALEEAMSTGSPIFAVSQRDLAQEQPEGTDVYKIGTIANVRQLLHLPGSNVRVMVEGLARGRMEELLQSEPYLSVQVTELEWVSTIRNSARTEALIRQTCEQFERYCELVPQMAPEVLLHIMSNEDPGYIADYIAQNIGMRNGDKQTILEELRPVQRLERLLRLLSREVEILTLEEELQGKLREGLEQNQRDYYLREQMKVLQQALGEEPGEDSECAEYRARIGKAKLPEAVEQKLLREVGRLEKQPFGSPEAAVLRNYLDICLELPWNKKTKERRDITAAKRILDRDHYGIEKVKERILEFLSVKQLAPSLGGQVLCLVGPPGVGKTSVAMSVAKATNRKLARVSLGGIHDEAEIRGHRKTYIGSMPGRIIAGINQAASSNPLLLLDEIDKLASSVQGDPASALLEVLDGEQNSTFRDHFLEVPFDLSDVLFITTANTTETIPKPLLDRMEIIELTSYTDEEKVLIAQRHLLPKELARHGLKKGQLKISDGVLRKIIRGYTREAGVRGLERELAALCRRTAKAVVEGEKAGVRVTGENLEELLGVRKFPEENTRHTEQVGVVNGLAWTQAGGELLEVEVNVVPGSGKIELTGNLGDVMKESAKTALSYVRSRADQLGIEREFYKTKDIHVHFPEGAVPKDGPSAGAAIAVAMVSALTNIPVKPEVAMTGEITLRGRVLPIGGLKEKTMAALRCGIRQVVIPRGNEKDLAEIDQTVRGKLCFTAVESADEVLAEALSTRPVAAVPVMPGLPVQKQLRGPQRATCLKQ